MALDIEKTISQYVKNQFPDFYKEEGELFIAFMKAYYEWMETQGRELYHSRRLTDYKDIDKTLDDFILSFKNKYLANIQFNVATNKQLFIKNALEFYRAKGTPRAVDLFFKLIYGIEASVYQPASDLFRLSDNTWINETYLELEPNPGNINFVGKIVFGSVSSATGFGEKLVRVKRGSLFIDALYISGIDGDFRSEETVYALDDIEEFFINAQEGDVIEGKQYRNKMIGSLTSFDIISSDPDFVLGERVYVADGTGKKGTAIVVGITNAVGIVNFDLVDGGWGYSDEAQVIGSKRTFRMDNVTFTNKDFYYHTSPFEIFQTANQDLIRFYLDEANAESRSAALDLALGTEIYATVNDVAGANIVWEGVLVDKSVASSYLTINYTKANYENANGDITTDDGVYILGNNNITWLYANNDGSELSIAIEANTDTLDESISGNVIAVSNVFTIEYTTDLDAPLEPGLTVYQVNQDNQIFARATVANTFANTTSGQTYVNLISQVNFFRSDLSFSILGNEDANNIFNTVKLSNVNIGCIEANLGEEIVFKLYANTYAGNTSLGTHASGDAKNETSTYATRAVASISGLSDQQSQFYYETTDKDGAPLIIDRIDFTAPIDEVANQDSADPGSSYFPWISVSANTIEYSNTTLEDALNYTSTAISIGSITSLIITDPGEGYGQDPFFIAYDPLSKHVERYDFFIRYADEGEEENLLKTFRVGEKIFVSEGGVPSETKIARIFDFDIANREIRARRLFWTPSDYDDPVDSGNTLNRSVYADFRNGETITGEITGVSAVIENVDEMRMHPHVGRNALINSTALTGSGFATDLKIENSGFGYFGKNYNSSFDVYEPGENLTLASFFDSEKNVLVKGYLGKQGIAPGTHPNRRSFLSSDKYLLDSDFYQEYSYQVLTALPFTKYKQTLIDVLHMAGSKPFGGYVGTSEESIDITPTSTINLYDIKQFGLFINQNTFYANTVVST